MWAEVLTAAETGSVEPSWRPAAIFGLVGVTIGGAISLLGESFGFRRHRAQARTERMLDACGDAYAAVDAFALSVIAASDTSNSAQREVARTRMHEEVSRAQLFCPAELEPVFERIVAALHDFETGMGHSADRTEYLKSEVPKLNIENQDFRRQVRRAIQRR